MRAILISIVLLFSFCSGKVSYQQLISQNGILSLNESNFKDKTGIDQHDINKRIAGGSDWLILFYDEQEEESTKFIDSILLGAHNLIKGLQFKVAIAAISCQTNRKLCKSFRILQRPTLYYLSNIGKNILFTETLSSKQEFIQFIKVSHEGKQYKKNSKMFAFAMIIFFFFVLSLGIIVKWIILGKHQNQTKMVPIYDKNEQMYVLKNDNIQIAEIEDCQNKQEDADVEQIKINNKS